MMTPRPAFGMGILGAGQSGGVLSFSGMGSFILGQLANLFRTFVVDRDERVFGVDK